MMMFLNELKALDGLCYLVNPAVIIDSSRTQYHSHKGKNLTLRDIASRGRSWPCAIPPPLSSSLACSKSLGPEHIFERQRK